MNVYLFIVVPFMAIMCIVFAWFIVGDIRYLLRSMRDENIKHRTGRSYGQAAVFVGTACLFIGAPQQCDDLCDDLWHHGQQAHVEQLTSETEFNII